MFVLGLKRCPLHRSNHWSPARVQRIRLHPSISSMNRAPPPLRGKTGAGVLPNTRLTPNWGQRVGLGNRQDQAQETYDVLYPLFFIRCFFLFVSACEYYNKRRG